MIDIKHVGVSVIRTLNADTLRELDKSILILKDREEPVAVLISYPLFKEIQDTILKARKAL